MSQDNDNDRMELPRHGSVAELRVAVDVPDTPDLEGVDAAERRVLQAAASGEIPYRAGLALMKMLDHRRRAIGDRVLEDRMDVVEARNKQRQRQKEAGALAGRIEP